MGVIVTQNSIDKTMGEIISAIIEFQEELGKKVLAVLGMEAEFVGVPDRHRPNFLDDLPAEIKETLKNYILADEKTVEFTKDEWEDAITEAKDDICLMIHEAETHFTKEMLEAIYGETNDSDLDTDVEAFSDLEKKIGKILEEGLATEEGEEEE